MLYWLLYLKLFHYFPPFRIFRYLTFRTAFGDAVVDHYVHTAEWEQFEYDRRITDWELKRGFERY